MRYCFNILPLHKKNRCPPYILLCVQGSIPLIIHIVLVSKQNPLFTLLGYFFLYSTREQTFRQKFRGAKLLPEKLFSMRQVNVGLRFFAAQKNLTLPTWLQFQS
jgi:hypothetical protein